MGLPQLKTALFRSMNHYQWLIKHQYVFLNQFSSNFVLCQITQKMILLKEPKVKCLVTSCLSSFSISAKPLTLKTASLNAQDVGSFRTKLFTVDVCVSPDLFLIPMFSFSVLACNKLFLLSIT